LRLSGDLPQREDVPSILNPSAEGGEDTFLPLFRPFRERNKQKYGYRGSVLRRTLFSFHFSLETPDL